jgi:metallo-beta-lactamase family protein
MDVAFLGATGTVTGSKYLVSRGSTRVLVDCGLFQGFKQLRLRNWAPLPVEPRKIDAVVLTHAHLDHSGYLPLLVKHGYRGPIYCTGATRDLCGILLPDSGHLQEEEASFANRHGFSRHKPALPLYTRRDAEASLRSFAPVDLDVDFPLGHGLTLRLTPSGHILGSSFVQLHDDATSILFSGDLGRPNDPIMKPPARIACTDNLIIESTYGDRLHDPSDPQVALAAVVKRTAERGGVVLIPAFAVGRTQTLLYYVQRLKTEGRIPDLPVFLDSPMAIDATSIFRAHAGEHRLTPAECQAMCGGARFVTHVEESKQLDHRTEPMIVIAASGMATGGRVLHHLKAFAPDPRNTILFAGYQAGGTRGAAILGGADSVKIHGGYVPIRAEVASLGNLSAHADAAEIMAWLGGFARPPRQTFVTHGEPPAADALRHRIEEELGWTCRVPENLATVELP